MLTPDQIERCNALWRRLYARGAVRWMAGMTCSRGIIVGVRHNGVYVCAGSAVPVLMSPADVVPDFNDHATRGCLLAMAREATGIAHLHTNDATGILKKPWHVWHVPHTEADSEPEALLLAIEEATNAK